MLLLNNFTDRISAPSFITLHGMSRGGGEWVAEKIRDIFSIDSDVFLNHRFGNIFLIKKLFKKYTKGHGLCTAGPRDIWIILVSAFVFRRTDVYLQVPYHLSVTWRDPVHLMAVVFYLLFVSLFSRNIFVNSKLTGRSIFFRRKIVIVPVLMQQIYFSHAQIISTKNAALRPHRKFNIVCRLNFERGRGSRDLIGLCRFLDEIVQWNKSGNDPITVEHYGECDDDIKSILLKHGFGVIRFNGWHEDWLYRSRGALIFFSKYEGFGLAAFEAAIIGRDVYVNEVFPIELTTVAPSILRFVSFEKNVRILDQLDIYG